MATIIDTFAAHVRGSLNSNLSHQEALANWCLGLAATAAKFNEVIYIADHEPLDLDGAKKELGAVYWHYFALIEQLNINAHQVRVIRKNDITHCRNRSYLTETTTSGRLRQQSVLLSINVGKVLDRIKTHLFCRNKLDDSLLIDDLQQVYVDLLSFCYLLDTPMREVLQDKLDEDFPSNNGGNNL